MADRVRVAPLDAAGAPISGSYDAAVLSKVIQTLSAHDSRQVLKNIGRALNAGGRIFIIGAILDDAAFVLLGLASAPLIMFGVVDLLGAIWTGLALRSSKTA